MEKHSTSNGHIPVTLTISFARGRLAASLLPRGEDMLQTRSARWRIRLSVMMTVEAVVAMVMVMVMMIII